MSMGFFAGGASGAGARDPDFANVVSLLHFNGANGGTSFPDRKGKSWSPNGNAQLSTTNPKFGSACLLLDGSGDSISASAHADFSIFAGNFAVEFWFNLVSNTPNQCLFEIGSAGNNRMNVSVSSGNIILFSDIGSPGQRISSGAPTAGAWHFCQLLKSGSTFTLGVNGASVGTSGTTAYPSTASLPCRYGNSVAGGVSVNGRIDEARITKGVSRTLTLPTEPFPNFGP